MVTFSARSVQTPISKEYNRIMKKPTTRKVTNQLLEMLDEGALDPRALAEACLAYMSEGEVADMAHDNELLPDEDENEDEEEC